MSRPFSLNRPRPESKAGDLRTVGGVLCVRRQAAERDLAGTVTAVVARGRKPVWEWVPVWAPRGEFVGCECRGGPPEDRCDRKWMRCNGRLSEHRRRVKAILAYRDPDAEDGPVRPPGLVVPGQHVMPKVPT